MVTHPTHHLPTQSDTHCTLCNIARTSPEMHDVCVGTAAEPAADGPKLWDTIAADLRAGRSLRAISAERHVGKDLVQRIRHTLSPPAPEPSPAKLAHDARITELWNAGTPVREIGTEFKVSDSRVSQIAKRLGLTSRTSGGRNSSEIRQKVETLLRAGKPNAAVARECGIARDTAADIRRGLGLAPYRRPVAAVKKKRAVMAPKPKPGRVVVAKPASAPPKTIRPTTRFANFHMRGAGRRARITTQEEQQMIADHIARHGVTRLPAAALEVTTAVICPEDRAALNAYRAEQEAQWQPQQPRGVAKARMRA